MAPAYVIVSVKKLTRTLDSRILGSFTTVETQASFLQQRRKPMYRKGYEKPRNPDDQRIALLEFRGVLFIISFRNFRI